jgi:(2Fe-2S) ferredoxin
MKREKIPYVKTIFVCTNSRTDGKIACANPGCGGDVLCHKLKEMVKAAGLKSKIRVARSGCLDLCAQGPNLFIYPEGIWHSHVQEKDLPKIIEHILEP